MNLELRLLCVLYICILFAQNHVAQSTLRHFPYTSLSHEMQIITAWISWKICFCYLNQYAAMFALVNSLVKHSSLKPKTPFLSTICFSYYRTKLSRAHTTTIFPSLHIVNLLRTWEICHNGHVYEAHMYSHHENIILYT